MESCGSMDVAWFAGKIANFFEVHFFGLLYPTETTTLLLKKKPALRQRDLIPICSFTELDMIIMKEYPLKEHPTVVVCSFSQPPIPIPMTKTTTNLWSKQAGFLEPGISAWYRKQSRRRQSQLVLLPNCQIQWILIWQMRCSSLC